MTRWLALGLAVLSLASCRGRFDQLDEFTRSRYIDIYEPLFARGEDEDGRAVFRSARDVIPPQSFPAVKGPDVARVFVVGGSVAHQLCNNGALYDALQRAYSPRRLEFVSCGISGNDSYRDKLVALEVLKYQPDLLLILSGNNEFYWPVKIDVALYRAKMILRRFAPFRALDDDLHSSPRTPPSRERRLAELSRNLDEIGAAARKRGVSVVFCALPAGARLPPDAHDEKFSVFADKWRDPDFVSPWLSLVRGKASRALDGLRAYAERHPGDAETDYEVGRAEEAVGDWDGARKDYARSLDLQDWRCGPAKNDAIRAAAARYGRLADLSAAFGAFGEHGLSAGESLIDGVHWYTGLNGLAARTILEAAGLDAAAEPSAAELFAAAAPEEKAEEEVRAAAKILMLSGGPGQEEFAVSVLQSAFQASARTAGEALRSAGGLTATKAPGETPGRMAEIEPRLAQHAGEALRRLGRTEDALAYFDQALRGDPGLFWALVERSWAERSLGRAAAAREDLARARRAARGVPEFELIARLEL